ncbi:MAG: DUF4333 domain-containing protein [Solirubrobacterales bacterium]|nr:DUF4333 domain-containing protein [Solirubrobacterales bacterium]
MRPAILCLSLVLAVPIAGCGEQKIDPVKTGSQIRELVAEQVGASVASVTCPSGLVATKGLRFTCAVAGTDGTRGDADVTVADERGRLEVGTPFLKVSAIQKAIAGELGRHTRDVEVACPEIVPLQRGETFTCTSSTGAVDVRLTDDKGHFSYRAS